MEVQKHQLSLKSLGVNTFMKLFPLSNNVMTIINFVTGDGLQWLHKQPQESGGLAIDGFLGMVDDNLIGNVKYKDWNQITNQMVYWKLLAEHNMAMLDTMEDGLDKTNLQNTIQTLTEMIEMDLVVKLNK